MRCCSARARSDLRARALLPGPTPPRPTNAPNAPQHRSPRSLGSRRRPTPLRRLSLSVPSPQSTQTVDLGPLPTSPDPAATNKHPQRPPASIPEEFGVAPTSNTSQTPLSERSKPQNSASEAVRRTPDPAATSKHPQRPPASIPEEFGVAPTPNTPPIPSNAPQTVIHVGSLCAVPGRPHVYRRARTSGPMRDVQGPQGCGP